MSTVKTDSLLDQALQAGILGDEIHAVQAAMPANKRESATDVLSELVRLGKLTRFQATHILQGKAKALVLGNYILQEPLGQGGMGVVFRAKHTLMERTAAIKLLPAQVDKNTENVQRFLREVKAAAQLKHPNIVQAYDAGSANGRYFLAMECVEGKTLDKVIKERGKLPVSIAVDYVVQAAQGLGFAHQRGIIHRDIKPGNLILGPKNRVQILDMGLARIVNGDSNRKAALTAVDTSMGTVDFMAPEQALELKHADARSDIYSLGCTLYFLIRGDVMFAGAPSTTRLLAHQQKEAPSLCEGRGDVPLKLDAIFQRMVAKRPEDRYTNVAELLVDFQKCQGTNPAVMATKPAAAPPPPPAVTDSSDMQTMRSQKTRRFSKKKRAKEGTKLNPIAVGATIAVLVLIPLILGSVYLWARNQPDPNKDFNERLGREAAAKKNTTAPSPHNVPPSGGVPVPKSPSQPKAPEKTTQPKAASKPKSTAPKPPAAPSAPAQVAPAGGANPVAPALPPPPPPPPM